MQTRNLIGSFTLGMLLTAIPVLSAKASEVVPNLYQFQGKDVSISYSTTSFIGCKYIPLIDSGNLAQELPV